MSTKDIIVIGGGPAGITLAKRLGRHFDMAVIRPEPHSMIYCAMPYAIEGLLPPEKTFKKDELVTASGAELIREHVTSINVPEKYVVLESGGILHFQRLVIATGAIPLIPQVPGARLEGVMGFKTQEDMETIINLCRNGLRNAVVVGAGAIGVELVQALRTRNIQVTLVDMLPTILGNMLDEDMTTAPTEILAREGIQLALSRRVSALEGSSRVSRVLLDNGQAIELEPDDSEHPTLVVFCVGVRPELTLLKDTGIEVGPTGILVDGRMQTNIPYVYACGDCVQFKSALTGEVISGKLATNAVPMAKVLAANLLGEDRVYPGFYNGAATKIGEVYVGSTGLTVSAASRAGFNVVTGMGKLFTRFPVMPDVRPLTVKLVADASSRRIIGGQILSGAPVTTQVDLLTLAIQKKCVLEDIRDLSYSAQPYQSFFPANNAMVMAAEQALKALRTQSELSENNEREQTPPLTVGQPDRS